MQVDDLPWPHDPFNCRWIDEFRASTAKDFGEFTSRLSDEQIAACPAHQGADWETAARVSVELVEAGTTTGDDVMAAARRYERCTAFAIISLLSPADAIHLDGEGGLGNGQHRVCAMKLAHVARCPIEA